MKRARQQRKKQNHYALLLNPKAAAYDFEQVKKLITAIRKKGDFYSLFESKSPVEMVKTAQKVSGARRWGKAVPESFVKRGKVTAVIAVGGDGTFNMVARSAAKTGIPVGIIPMGKQNNIARSLLGDISVDNAVKKIMNQSYRLVDYAKAGDHFIFSSAGFNFTYKLANYLEKNSSPRFAIGWNKIGIKIAEEVNRRDMVVKIDSFRFETRPAMIQMNLHPFANGLVFSDLSINDDHMAEVIIDFNADKKEFGNYLKNICKRKYVYGSDFRIYRGKSIGIEGYKGLPMYIDGDIVKPDGDVLDIVVQEKQLKVFC